MDNPIESGYILDAFERSAFLLQRCQKLQEETESNFDPDLKIEYLHALHAFFESEYSILIRLTPYKDHKLVSELIAEMESNIIPGGLARPPKSLSDYYYLCRQDIRDKLEALTGEDFDEGVDTFDFES